MSTRKGPEALTQAAIMDYLAVRHIWHKRMNSGAVVSEYKGRSRMIRYGTEGMADILATIPPQGVSWEERNPKILWIEVKSATGKQSPAQVEFQTEVEDAGHTYIMARSIDDVAAVL